MNTLAGLLGAITVLGCILTSQAAAVGRDAEGTRVGEHPESFFYPYAKRYFDPIRYGISSYHGSRAKYAAPSAYFSDLEKRAPYFDPILYAMP
ncbi:unnamed protein product [Dibothriocephalus latus]|uniref:Uncharacterized protein n=1 Tax=Dibothriocephalus latus TaxID=60516 RepID=A0A3P7LVX3_DIBLA|nr:unnamed protein product [Dibothriocephalus latus]